MENIKKLGLKEAEKFIPASDIKEYKRKINGHVFIINKEIDGAEKNPILELEIAYRKCLRLGVFNK